MEDLLKAAVRERNTAGPGPCLDAERLAAWADGSLPPDQVTAVEAHLADCARCQAMMAAFARAADEAPAARPAAVVPFAPRRATRWWIPAAVGTIAATLVVWVAVRDRVAPQPESVISQALPASADSARSPEATAPPASVAPPLAPATPAESREEKAAAAAAPASKNEAQAKTQLAQPSAIPAGPPPPAALPPPPAPALAAPAKVAAVVPVLLEFGPPAAAADTAERVVVGGAAGARSGGGAAGRGAMGVERAAQADAAVAALRLRWRILQGGSVLQSRDGGATWEPVELDPAWPRVTTGVAPSIAFPICWLAGRSGLVLLSTDGATFVRVAAPAEADISTIRARSARDATVTTVDGRTFETTDGGQTWKPAL